VGRKNRIIDKGEGSSKILDGPDLGPKAFNKKYNPGGDGGFVWGRRNYLDQLWDGTWGREKKERQTPK